MRAVAPEGGGLTHPEHATYGKVRKGYTSFISGDVITAKITPCMENGKTTVVPPVPGDVCFGSTEFTVLRPEEGIEPRWMAQLLLRHDVRRSAQRSMGGAVGQMRVPVSFYESLEVPLPPSAEQARIADSLDELLSDLDAGIGALERAKARLKLYRASVLKAAVDGSLTATWRQQNPGAEPASALLQRVLVERRRRWEEDQLARFRAKGQEPPRNWKVKYREPAAPDTSQLSPLPTGWTWATADQLLLQPIINGISVRGSDDGPGVPALRLSAMSGDGFDYSKRRYLPLEPAEVSDLWISEGDFFVSRANGSKHLVGRGTLAQAPPDAVIFPDTMMRLRLAACLQWVPAVWPSSTIRSQLERAAKTTAGIWKLAQPDVARIVLPLPPADEADEAISIVESQMSVIDHTESDIESRLQAAQSLRQSILRHAFSGQLVPQDQNDEPASVLLARIAAERAARETVATAARKARAPQARARRARATSSKQTPA